MPLSPMGGAWSKTGVLIFGECSDMQKGSSPERAETMAKPWLGHKLRRSEPLSGAMDGDTELEPGRGLDHDCPNENKKILKN